MEELFCIGCGAPIQTTDKAGLGFHSPVGARKGLETGEVYCQLTVSVSVTTEMKSQMSN